MLKDKVIELLKDKRMVILLGTSNLTIANELVKEFPMPDTVVVQSAELNHKGIKLLPLSYVAANYTTIDFEGYPCVIYKDAKEQGPCNIVKYTLWLRDFVSQISRAHNAYVVHCHCGKIIGLSHNIEGGACID